MYRELEEIDTQRSRTRTGARRARAAEQTRGPSTSAPTEVETLAKEVAPALPEIDDIDEVLTSLDFAQPEFDDEGNLISVGDVDSLFAPSERGVDSVAHDDVLLELDLEF